MARKISLLVFLCFFCVNLFPAEKDGYVLLEKVVVASEEIVEFGAGGKDEIDTTLEAILADAKEAKAQGAIDPVFYKRFHRILIILKLAMVESSQGVLGPLIKREVSEFVEDTTGEKGEMEGVKAVGTLAAAVSEEILNLHLYLRTRKDRDRIMEEYKKKAEIKKK